MERLKCGDKEVQVKDFLIKDSICSIDIKLQNEKEFKDFLVFYNGHHYGKGIFHFEIGEKSFDGWLGLVVYDKDYNIRLYAGIYEPGEEINNKREGYVYDIKESIIGLSSAIKSLCVILQEKGVIDEDQCKRVQAELNCPERALDFDSLVSNVPTYLQSKHKTMDDLRAGK